MSLDPVQFLVAQLEAAMRGDAPLGDLRAVSASVHEAAMAVLVEGQFKSGERLVMQAQIGCRALELLSIRLAASTQADLEVHRIQRRTAS